MNQDTKLNTALVLLRLGGECFGQHNLLSTASEAERRAALERFFQWWNGRVVPFLAEVDKLSSLPFKIQTGYRAWAAIPCRAFSPEVDYGVNWGLLSPRDWPHWRASFIVNSGEVYAVEFPGMERFVVLGEIDPNREAAEKALKGWADGEMTLLSLAGRFDPPEVTDPVAEAAEELKKCGIALKRIGVAYAKAESRDAGETVELIGQTLRQIGFASKADGDGG